MSDYLQKLFGFDGRVAVVIGGTGVLGGELCNGLAQAGATVVVAGRSEERGKSPRRRNRKARRQGNVCRSRRRRPRIGEGSAEPPSGNTAASTRS